MTLAEMFASGNAVQLIIMGVIFIVMILLLSMLGNGIAARYADKEKTSAPAPVATRTGNNDAVTAAITAAVNEYKKTNK